MKKSFNINIRVASEDWGGFRAACTSCDTTASAVIRDLCKATVSYVEQYCQDGRWRAPELMDPTEIARMKESVHAVKEMVQPLIDMAKENTLVARPAKKPLEYPIAESQLRKVAEKKRRHGK